MSLPEKSNAILGEMSPVVVTYNVMEESGILSSNQQGAHSSEETYLGILVL